MEFSETWRALRAALERDDGQADPDEVARVVTEHGLDDPKRLAELLVERARSGGGQAEAERPIAPARSPGRGQAADGQPIKHRMPKGPLLLNGAPVTESDLADLEGTPLHYVAVPYSATETRLVAFDEPLPLEEMALETRRRVAAASVLDPFAAQRAELTTAARTSGRPVPPEAFNVAEPLPDPVMLKAEDGGDPGIRPRSFPPAGADFAGGGGSLPSSGGCGFMGVQDCDPPTHWPERQAQFFDAAGYDGNWFWLQPGYAIPDLRRMVRGASIFGDDGDWNDVISSIRSGRMPNSYLELCEHVDFGGSTLSLGVNQDVGNLTDLGWNDRVSSVRHIEVVSISTF